MSANYSIYIIQNPAGKFYIGLSQDVPLRLCQHNAGISKWTRGKGPWRLVWQQGNLTLPDARKLELQLKRQKGGDGLYRITGLKNRSGS